MNVNNIYRDEWDATVLQGAKMAKDTTLNAEELKEKMYSHDAACRIIGNDLKQKNVFLF